MSPELNLSKFRKILSFDTVCFFWWGLLSPIQTVETRKAHPRAPNQVPRASHLGPLMLEWWIHWGGVREVGVALNVSGLTSITLTAFEVARRLCLGDGIGHCAHLKGRRQGVVWSRIRQLRSDNGPEMGNP